MLTTHNTLIINSLIAPTYQTNTLKMNKKTISIICLTILYSIFFYEQHVGINFLLFTLATIGCFYFQSKESFKNKWVVLLSFGAIFTASFAAIHGSNLSLWATIISLMVLPGVIMTQRSNVFIDFATTVVNIACSPAFMILELVESSKKGKGKSVLRFLKYLVPLVFIIAFFFIYRAMNPLFEKFTQEIAEFISIGWVFFTLGGFILVYSIYKQRRAEDVDNWEKNLLIRIDPSLVKTPKWNEALAFILLFIVLNLMLVSVNLMDLKYLYLGEGMPDGITHKQFVHKGVFMLILSIVLGISILLFFFRGTLNFTKNKHLIKALAFLWVAQNVFMVVSTTLRNTMYVDAALLTYKRIGVYFWLFFALVGLVTLIIKLKQNKTVWFLARYNFATLFIVLLLSSATDWDIVLSNFNLSRAHQMEEISSLDKNYMLSISEGNIAGLFAIKELEGFEIDSVYSYQNRHLSNSNWLDCKVYDFLLDDAEGDWRSYSVRRNRVRNDINLLHENGALNSLELQSHYVESLEPIYSLNKIEELNLNSNNFNTPEKLAGINELGQLKKLSLNDNYIEILDTLLENKNLIHLSLSNNEIRRLAFLKSFPNIDTLELNQNKLVSLVSLPKLNKLTSLSLNSNPLNDISKLGKLSNLKHLSLNQINHDVGKFPQLKQLESLIISMSKNVLNVGFSYLKELPKLTTLNVTSNELKSLNVLLNPKTRTAKAPLLQTLYVSSNELRTLYGIEQFEQLNYIDASNNKLYDLTGVELLSNLKQLYLQNNTITDITLLSNLTQLEQLNLSNNRKVKNLDALINLNSLTYLNLSNTELNSLKSINSKASLTHLHLSGCRIGSWKSISSYKNLESISVSYIKKEDIPYFKSLKQLKYVSTSNTEEAVVELLKQELDGVEVY